MTLRPAPISIADSGVGLRRAVGLSAFDRELIALLQVDGRLSYAELARALSAPERQIRRRLAELRESGVLSIVVIGDPNVLGYRTLAIVAMRVGARRVDDVVTDLARISQVDYVGVTAGRFNVFAEIWCRDLSELRSIVEDSVRTLDGVEHAEVFPYLWLHAQQTAPRPKGPAAAAKRPESELVLDDLDWRIISELSTDGRAPVRAIASRVGTSETQLRRRFDRLKESGAIRVAAVPEPYGLGLDAIARIAIKVGPGYTFKDVADALCELVAVTYVAVCTGQVDIFCEAACRDSEELGHVIDAVRQIAGVQGCEVFRYLGPIHFRPVRVAAPMATT